MVSKCERNMIGKNPTVKVAAHDRWHGAGNVLIIKQHIRDDN